jgi:hypothetical protein
MPSQKLFRDRVVSMEQTFEAGEKYQDLLKAIVREALPEFVFQSAELDHEHDTYVMRMESSDGRHQRICWTRMVLYDVERIPALVQNPEHPLRAKIVGFIRGNVGRPEIAVTYRHLEEGWKDTPAPKKKEERKKPVASAGARPSPVEGRSPAPPSAGGASDAPPRAPGPGRRRRRRGRGRGAAPGLDRTREAPAPVSAPVQAAPSSGPAEGGAPRSRRRRRRRRGRGGNGGGRDTGASPTGGGSS